MVFIGALGYFILPTDLIGDFIPVMGFTDDIALLSYAMTKAVTYINPELKEKARNRKEAMLHKKEASATARF